MANEKRLRYEVHPDDKGQWLLYRAVGELLFMAAFADRRDAERVALLLQRDERHTTRSLIDAEAAKKSFDAALTDAKRQGGCRPASPVSGYDTQLDG